MHATEPLSIWNEQHKSSTSGVSSSDRSLYEQTTETLDHVMAQIEDLYIENSALRQRFNGTKQGSYVL